MWFFLNFVLGFGISVKFLIFGAHIDLFEEKSFLLHFVKNIKCSVLCTDRNSPVHRTPQQCWDLRHFFADLFKGATPQLIGHWGVTTLRCIGLHRVATLWCIGLCRVATLWCLGHGGVNLKFEYLLEKSSKFEMTLGHR